MEATSRPEGRCVEIEADKQSLAYGHCIGKSYQEVQKGMCENEFKAFKECVQVSHFTSFPIQRRGVARDDESHW